MTSVLRRPPVAVFLLVVSVGVHASETTTNCCEVDSEACCPNPSIGDIANDLRVELDPTRCCPDPSGELWCGAYGVGGCTFCKTGCDDDNSECVECPREDEDTESGNGSASGNDDDSSEDNSEFGDITTSFVTSWVDEDWSDDIAYILEPNEAQWDDDISSILDPGSYDFSYNINSEYDCSSCSWDSMSALQQRLLVQRSRSLVCDGSCLTTEGHDEYGVTFCNYFNVGRECRACCHVRPDSRCDCKKSSVESNFPR